MCQVFSFSPRCAYAFSFLMHDGIKRRFFTKQCDYSNERAVQIDWKLRKGIDCCTRCRHGKKIISFVSAAPFG